jgi:glucose-1-phosphatase
MYKAIIFDLGKVLVHFDFKRGYRALEGLCPYPAADIPRRISTTDLVTRFETGLVEPNEFFRQFSELLELRVEYPRFCEIWSSIFDEVLIPEAMLAGLGRRYKLVLLSNTNAIHFDSIRKVHAALLRHFHDLVLSYEVKALKPDPRIFQIAVERAGCSPEACFYTDDIAAYTAAAREQGIDAVTFESTVQIQREMRARGIDWQ